MNARWVVLPICSIALSACAPFDYRTRMDLLGEPAPVSAATRTIVITPATNYVNVTGGETIRFVAGDRSFAWTFGEQFAPAFELNVAAPPGALDHKVIAYVAPNPVDSGDGGREGHRGRNGGHGGGGHGAGHR